MGSWYSNEPKGLKWVHGPQTSSNEPMGLKRIYRLPWVATFRDGVHGLQMGPKTSLGPWALHGLMGLKANQATGRLTMGPWAPKRSK